MIISGNLTLPEGVTPQLFLAQFFALADVNLTFSISVEEFGTEVKITGSPTVLYDNIAFVRLDVLPSDVKRFEGISSIDIVGADGTELNIKLIQDVLFNDFAAAIESSYEEFEALLMPGTGQGFFLNHTGSSGGDYMEGFSTDDFLNGQLGDDVIIGKVGNDALIGGDGNDTLNGGPGDDTLTGGAGEDLFKINPNEDKIEVSDLNASEDRVDLTGFNREEGLVNAVLNSENGFLIDGTEALFYDGNGGLIRLPLDRVILPGIQGTNTSEELLGSEAAEAILGLLGDDTISGGGGGDTIDGGAGEDTAVYGGNQRDYTLFIDPMAIEIQNRLSPSEYRDLLENVEFLDFETDLDLFSDGLFDIRLFSGAANLEVDELAQIIELYIAYLDRAPDAIGLLFWATAFENGATLEELAAYFVDQPEIRDRFPDTLSNKEFVRQVYDQALGREPDEDGAGFWKGMLDDELVGRDEFILYVLGGAKAAPAEGASQAFVDQQAADRAFLGHKTDIGAEFGIKKGMSDVGNAISAMELFDGTQSSLDTALAAINEYYVEALGPESGEFLIQLTGMSAVDFTE